VEVILRLLDADQLWRLRVVEHGQVGEHLERAIGGELRQNGPLKRCVFDLQQQPAIGHQLRIHFFQARHTLREGRQDVAQTLGILFLEVLDDVGQVIAGGREAFLRTGLGHRASLIGGEIGEVPSGDEPAQRTHARMPGELAQGADSQHLWSGQPFLDALIALIGHLAADYASGAALKIEEPERLAPLAAPPLEPLGRYKRPLHVLIDRQMISNDGGFGLLSVFQLELNRPVTVACAQLLEPAALIPGFTQPDGEALGQKREHVEHRGLAAAVWPQQHGERGDVLELQVVQRAVVLHAQVLDARDGATFRFLGRHKLLRSRIQGYCTT